MNRPARILRPDTAFSLTPRRQRKRKRNDRQEDTPYLRFIHTLPCLLTGANYTIEACHIRYADAAHEVEEAGIGRKPDDWRTLPLTRSKHHLQHTLNERAFWELEDVDPYQVARALYSCFDKADLDTSRELAIEVLSKTWREKGLIG